MSMDIHNAALATKSAFRRALDWTLLRTPLRPEELVLSAEALVWLSRMPVQARPLLLSRRYPRVVNQLAANWHNSKRVKHDFEALLVDSRGERQGFPADIVQELVGLRAYYDEVLSKSDVEWDDPYMF